MDCVAKSRLRWRGVNSITPASVARGPLFGPGSGRPRAAQIASRGPRRRAMVAVRRIRILSSFRRLDAPRLTETDDLGQPKRLATRAISSALALPSVGGERSCAIQAPDSS